VVLVAAAEGEPTLEHLRAFVSNGQQGVRIRAGTWHHGLISLDAGAWAVLERRAQDGAVDCDVRVLAPEVTLVWPPRMAAR
jgi:ureidoglycolate lyase